MTDERAHTSRNSRSDLGRDEKSNRNLVYTAVASAIVALIVGAASMFGGRVMAGSDTSIRLSTQIERILDDNKDQGNDLKEIKAKLSDLYTRREAQADREAFERRFASVEIRLSEVGRRLEVLEANQRFMQQFVLEKGSAVRRP